MTSNFLALITFIIAFFNLFLAFLVLFRNHKNKSHLSFFMFSFFIFLWLIFNLLIDFSSSDTLALFWWRTTNLVGSWMVYFLLIFSVMFPRLHKDTHLKMLKYYILIPICWTFLSYTNLISAGVEFQGWGYNSVRGILTLPFFLYYLITLVLSLYFLITKYHKSKGIDNFQLRYVFLGLLLSTFLALVFSAMLPLLTGSSETAKFAPLSTIFFIGFTSYAIVKHRLMDIRLVVARSISYSLLIVILAGIYAAGVISLEQLLFPEVSDLSLGQGILRTFLAVVIAFTFQPLKNIITKSTDNIFFKDQYDVEKFLKETNNILSTHIVLTELLYKTLDHILKTLKIENGLFAVVEDDKIYAIQSIGYKTAPMIEIKDLKYLSRFPLVVFDEEEEGNRKKNILRHYNAVLSVRLIEDNQFAGFLFLGDKKSGDIFSAKDIEIMEILAPQVAMAMQRAKQYEEIQKFNLTLKAEILRKTKKLREANDHLKELDKAKDEFISMASHQLRTPLTAIKGYLSMLLEGDAGEIKVGQFDFINEAFQGANKMVNLINDLLNVSRMTTGKFFIDFKEVDIKSIINYEITQLAPTARNKGLYLKFEAPKVLPKVECDENKITQVVMNFIDNAIYYTETGGITVRASATKHNFVFEVQDTGIGVPKEARNNLFAKFYRADNAKRLRPDGTGLGIYLAKRVIEDHDGEIIFRTQLGKGSVFGFRIPVKSKIKMEENKK